jgi:hypothetical protein
MIRRLPSFITCHASQTLLATGSKNSPYSERRKQGQTFNLTMWLTCHSCHFQDTGQSPLSTSVRRSATLDRPTHMTMPMHRLVLKSLRKAFLNARTVTFQSPRASSVRSYLQPIKGYQRPVGFWRFRHTHASSSLNASRLL